MSKIIINQVMAQPSLGLRLNLSQVENDTLAMNRLLSPDSAVTANYEGEKSTQPPLLPSDPTFKAKRLGGATPAFKPGRLNMVSFADESGQLRPTVALHDVSNDKAVSS